MNKLKYGTEPEVKQENLAYSSTGEYSYMGHCPQMGSFVFDPTTMFNNNFHPQFNYNWINMPIQDPSHQYYGYYDAFYRNSAYSINPCIPPPTKPYEEFAMARTSDSMITSFYDKTAPFVPNYQLFPEKEVVQKNLINPIQSLDIGEQEFQKSDPEPIIKFEENSEQLRIRGERRLKTKMKNETKNIPKNYGKAMISFILSHLDWIQSQFGIQKRQELVAQLKKRKNSINAIVHLKDLWTNGKYSKQFRILSNHFIRKYSFAYIFNSRISNYSTHIKYKYKLQEALRSPGSFSRIKEY